MSGSESEEGVKAEEPDHAVPEEKFISKLWTYSGISLKDALKSSLNITANTECLLCDGVVADFRGVSLVNGDRGVSCLIEEDIIGREPILDYLQDKDINTLKEGLKSQNISFNEVADDMFLDNIRIRLNITEREQALVLENGGDISTLDKLSDMHWTMLELICYGGYIGYTIAQISSLLKVHQHYAGQFCSDLERLGLIKAVHVKAKKRPADGKRILPDEEHHGFVLSRFIDDAMKAGSLPLITMEDVLEQLSSCPNGVAMKDDIIKVLREKKSRISLNKFLRDLNFKHGVIEMFRAEFEGQPVTCIKSLHPHYNIKSQAIVEQDMHKQLMHHIYHANNSGDGVEFATILSLMDCWHARTKIEETLHVWVKLKLISCSSASAPYSNSDTFTWQGVESMKKTLASSASTINRRHMKRLRPGMFSELAERRNNIVKQLLKDKKVLINSIELRRHIQSLEQQQDSEGSVKVMDKKVLNRIVAKLSSENVCRQITRNVEFLTGRITSISIILSSELADDAPEIDQVCQEYSKANAFRFAPQRELEQIDVKRLVKPKVKSAAEYIATGKARVQLDVGYEDARMERIRLIHLFILNWKRDEIEDRVREILTKVAPPSSSSSKSTKDAISMKFSELNDSDEESSNAAQIAAALKTITISTDVLDLIENLPLKLFCATIRLKRQVPGLDELLTSNSTQPICQVELSIRQKLFKATTFKADSEIHSILTALADFGLYVDADRQTAKLKIATSLLDTRRAKPKIEEYRVTNLKEAQDFWFSLKSISLKSRGSHTSVAGIPSELNLDRQSTWGVRHRDFWEFCPQLQDQSWLSGKKLGFVLGPSATDRRNMKRKVKREPDVVKTEDGNSTTSTPKVKRRKQGSKQKNKTIEKDQDDDGDDSENTSTSMDEGSDDNDEQKETSSTSGVKKKRRRAANALERLGFNANDVAILKPYADGSIPSDEKIEQIANETGYEREQVKSFLEATLFSVDGKATTTFARAKKRKEYVSRASKKIFSDKQDDILLTVAIIRTQRTKIVWKTASLWAYAKQTSDSPITEPDQLPKITKQSREAVEILRRRLATLQKNKRFTSRASVVQRQFLLNGGFAADDMSPGTILKEMEAIYAIVIGSEGSKQQATAISLNLPDTLEELQEVDIMTLEEALPTVATNQIQKQRREAFISLCSDNLKMPTQELSTIEQAQYFAIRKAVIETLWNSSDNQIPSALILQSYPQTLINQVLIDLQREYVVTQIKSRLMSLLRPDNFNLAAQYKQQLTFDWGPKFLNDVSEAHEKLLEGGFLPVFENPILPAPMEALLLELHSRRQLEWTSQLQDHEIERTGATGSRAIALTVSDMLKGTCRSAPLRHESQKFHQTIDILLSAPVFADPGPIDSKISLLELLETLDISQHHDLLNSLVDACKQAEAKGLETRAFYQTYQELYSSSSGNLPLWQCVAFLLRYKWIYRCDANKEIRFVHREFAIFWAGTHQAHEDVCGFPIIVPSWKTPDGGVRDQTYKLYCQALANHLMQNMIISENHLHSLIDKVLTRKELQDLLSHLMAIGCVERRCWNKQDPFDVNTTLTDIPPSLDIDQNEAIVSVYSATSFILTGLAIMDPEQTALDLVDMPPPGIDLSTHENSWYPYLEPE